MSDPRLLSENHLQLIRSSPWGGLPVTMELLNHVDALMEQVAEHLKWRERLHDEAQRLQNEVVSLTRQVEMLRAGIRETERWAAGKDGYCTLCNSWGDEGILGWWLGVKLWTAVLGEGS